MLIRNLQNDLYSEILDKASQLCYSLIENHPFTDGNKRIGVHLTLLFLNINNIELSYTQKDLIEFGLNVASGKMAREDIKQWLINHKQLNHT